MSNVAHVANIAEIVDAVQCSVPFVVVNNPVGGSTLLLWRKLENRARALRMEQGSDAAFVGFRWLAERRQNCHSGNWLPLHRRQRIGF